MIGSTLKAPHAVRAVAAARRGATAVEAAIVLPVAITLMLACVDFARAISVHMTLTAAARVAAEYGATHAFSASTAGHWESQLREAAVGQAEAIPGFAADQLQLGVETQGTPHADLEVAVTVAYPFRTAVRWPGVPHEFTLRSQSGMRQYR